MSSSTIDYSALAKQFGGTSAPSTSVNSNAPAIASNPNTPDADKPPVAKAPADAAQKVAATTIDYSGLAKQFGGTSAPTAQESTAHKLFLGKNTVLGQDTPQDLINEMGGVSDILHGDIKKGAGEVWDAEKPHVIPGSRLEKLIQKVNPNFKGEGGTEFGHQQLSSVGNAAPIDAAQFIDKDKHPMAKAIAETAQSFLSPNSVAMLVATGGMGMVESPQALGMANRLVSAGFAFNTLVHAYQMIKPFKKAYDNGDGAQAEYILTHMVLSGAMAALMAQHAATGLSPVENAWTKAGAKADLAVGEGIKAVGNKVAGVANSLTNLIPNKTAGVSPADHMDQAIENMYTAIKPGKSLVADDFKQTLKDAAPQLSVIANKNPNVGSPKEMADVIQDHLDDIHGQLQKKAFDMRGAPSASMPELTDNVGEAMRKGWDKVQGKFTPDEIQKAEAAVFKQLGIETRSEKDPDTGEVVVQPFRTGPVPDLYTAENIRKRFSDDSKPAFQGPGVVPSAEAYAKAVANQAMREDIDAKFEENGVSDVKEWRKQEVPLIDVRDALYDAQARADAAGKWSPLKFFTERKGWGGLPAITGMVLGGAPGAVLGELSALGLDWWRDQKTNPNVLTSKALEHFQEAGVDPNAKVPTKPQVKPPKMVKVATNVPKVIEEPDAIEQHIDDEVEKRMLSHREDGKGPKLPDDELRFDYRQEVRKEMGLPPEPEEGMGEVENPKKGAGPTTPAPKVERRVEGPDWERTVRGTVNGKDAGGVGYKVDAQGNARVFGAVVPRELRNQGVGTEHYEEMIRDARQKGVKTLSSDPTGTKPGALRVWEKLGEKGYPVEKITQADGRPGYKLDLTKLEDSGKPPAQNPPIRAYHGTAAAKNFNEFETEGRLTDEEGNPLTSGSGADPTSYLGAHFAKEPGVANKFAMRSQDWMRGRYEAGEGEEGAAGPRVHPVDLNFKNPKNFGSESNMRNYIYQGDLSNAGYAGDELLNKAMEADGIETPDEGGEEVDKWLGKYQKDPEFRAEQNQWIFERARPGEDEDDVFHEGAQHLAADARGRLQDEGHDAAIYKNEVEGGTGYVALNPRQIKSAFEPKQAVGGNVPKTGFGGSLRDDVHHELGHAIVADALGVGTTGGIKSDLHPENIGTATKASINMDFGKWGQDTDGKMKLDDISDHLPDMLTTLMGGGAGEEAFSGKSMFGNRGMGGDLKIASKMLTDLGYSSKDAIAKVEAAKSRAKDILTQPGIRDIVHKYSAEREEGLPPTHHMSEERVEQLNKEIRDERDKQESARQGNAPAGIGAGGGGGQANVAPAEGGGAGTAGQAVPHEVNYEHNFHEDENGNIVHTSTPQSRRATEVGAVPKTKEKKSLGLPGYAALAGAAALGAAGASQKPEEKSKAAPRVAPVTVPVVSATRTKEPVDIPSTLDEASKELNVPSFLTRAQAHHESNFNQEAVSPKGARGVMQLMPKTAESLGVDPFDTRQNIYGGVGLMSQLHNRFGHWDRALAAYNWTPDRVQNAIDTYGDQWLEHTPTETQKYVHDVMGEWGGRK